MRYRKLTVRNYRGVESSEVTFDPHGLTVVQGPNEAGKTSLGEAISILFDFPDSSKHSAITAIKPVHRDAGAEIELEAESGPYRFVYFKRFHKKQETRLIVTSPRPENHTGREAHDRAMEILSATLDINLWKALAVRQGVAIDQPDLAEQQSLSAALDKAAGGIPADKAEEGIFERVSNEYGRYFTAKGQEKSNLKTSREENEQAQEEVDEIEGKLVELDEDTESAARLQKEVVSLREREAQLVKEVESQNSVLQEINLLEARATREKLELESAIKSAELANRELTGRKELIEAVEQAVGEYQRFAESNKGWIDSLERAGRELQTSQAEYQSAITARKEADSLVAIRRQDYDYFNNLLFLSQFEERKARIDEARQNAAQAMETIANCRVDSEALEEIESLERDLLGTRARLESAAPVVRLRGIAGCDVQIEGTETTIAPDEIVDLSVSDRVRLLIPNHLEIEIAAGSSIDQLTRAVEAAKTAIASSCRKLNVEDPDQARAAFQDRLEALRKIEAKERIEKENLRDLTYDDLTDKLVRLGQTVPEYEARRKSAIPIAKDLSAAKIEYQHAQAEQTRCEEEWEAKQSALDAARRIREKTSEEHETNRVRLGSLKTSLEQLQARLAGARKTASDASLEDAYKHACEDVISKETIAREAENALRSRNPEKVKALAETAAESLATTRRRRESAQTELTEVQTRLKIHGEEGLHDKLQIAKSRLEKLSSESRSLFRRAAAARLLFNLMSEERDKARQAYVAPLKDRIERLGRLVFDETFQVELNENLQIVSRTSGGVTVPFDSLSGGTKEQLSLVFRLACSMIVAEEGGMPLIMDDALGYTDPERLRLMGAVLAKAAKDCQIVVLTCVPDRYAHVGEATIVSL